MFATIEDLVAFMEAKSVVQLDLKFCIPRGAWRHVSLSANATSVERLKGGIGFDGSSVGFRAVESGDLVLIPDPTTAWIDPFNRFKTLSVLCEAHEADTLEPVSGDPRRIARRAEQLMRDTGIADRALFGPEFEFYVFDRVEFHNRLGASGYSIQSRETQWSDTEGGHGHYIQPMSGYHAIPPQDCHWELRTEIMEHLRAMGIDVYYHHHEVGGPGQVEIEIPLAPLRGAADTILAVKYVAKQTARAQGQTATFMPKPLHSEAGSGMHCHQTLWRGEQNLFYDEAGYAGLSQTALHYIGGLLLHGPALLALTNPSTNSFRRLIPGFEAPNKTFFSQANRSAAIRVPKYATSHDTKRIEFRPPDGTANAYVMLAAQLVAGLDGIQRKIDPGEHHFGPIDENVFAWPADKQRTIGSLPDSLSHALEALEADHEFLLAGGVFTRPFLEAWLLDRRNNDVAEVIGRPHPWEVEQYFNV